MTWLTVEEYLHHKWPPTCFVFRNHNPVLCSFITYHRICIKSNPRGTTSIAGIAYHSGAPEFTPIFRGARAIVQSLDFCVVFSRSLFVLFLLVIVWSIFFDFRLPITPLVSSNFSYTSINIHVGLALWGTRPKDVLCKTCSVLLFVLKQPRVDGCMYLVVSYLWYMPILYVLICK
jgi:hypothetical protein